MHILITGAAGFIGQLMAKRLLNDEKGSHTLVLTDIVEPTIPAGVKWPQNAKTIQADLFENPASVIDKTLDAIYVFHGIMSAGSEVNFDLGMRVNFDATRALLEEVRKTVPGVRIIYASSQAVYGGELPLPVNESMLPTPESSYGAEKMMCEYFITEYHRRGFVNAILLRFPTVTVRPGKPTAAASSFLSGIIREPMQRKECIVPITDRSFRHWATSPRVLSENLEFALTLPRDALPPHSRAVNCPGIGLSVQDMIDSLARIGGEDKLQYIKEEEDPAIKPILYSWPADFDNTRGLSLGFKRDVSFDDAVRDFKEHLEAETASQ